MSFGKQRGGPRCSWPCPAIHPPVCDSAWPPGFAKLVTSVLLLCGPHYYFCFSSPAREWEVTQASGPGEHPLLTAIRSGGGNGVGQGSVCQEPVTQGGPYRTSHLLVVMNQQRRKPHWCRLGRGTGRQLRLCDLRHSTHPL